MGNHLKIFAQDPHTDPAWQLVFSDDFNDTVLNTSKWSQMEQGGPDYSNYRDACSQQVSVAYHKWYNFVVDDGTDTTNCKIYGGSAKLYTRKQNFMGDVWNYPACPGDSCRALCDTLVISGNTQDSCTAACLNNKCWYRELLPYRYTTSRLYSKTKFRYGYFEIRFKLPPLPPSPKTYKGFCPAFWLWNNDYSVHNYWSEIDIFEIKSYDPDSNKYNQYTNCVHYRGICPDEPCHVPDPYQGAYILSDTMHTAAVNWLPNKIEFFLDGVKIRESYNHPDSLIAMPIYADIGSPSYGWCNTLFDTINANGTHFPYKFEIDYIKVWQMKEDCDTSIVICNLDQTLYNNKLYKSVELSGTGCSSQITNQSEFSIYGTDYVLLNAGFSIDNNSNVFISASEKCKGYYYGPTVPESKVYNSPPSPTFYERYFY